MGSLLDAALSYASVGLPVFPLIAAGKVPAIKRGFYAASTNPETIRRYWRISNCNVGIRTGIASGFWVIDIDPGGDDHIRRLEAEHGPLPPTRTVITPRGGKHLWFKYVGPMPCTTGKIAPNIDTRGDGGYIATVPSITMDGTYSWLGDSKVELAIAPQWLLDLARKKKPTISERAVAGIKSPRNGKFDSYGRAALDREIAELAATPAGQRNRRLNYTAFRLFQLVAGGELDDRGIEDRLIDACEKNGLVADDGPRSVDRTIASGRSAGLQYPRSRKGAT
jgi:hypothetical protein